MKMEAVRTFGGVEEGDFLIIKKKNGGSFPAVVKKVINKGTSDEEIVFNLSRNLYFIVDKMFHGTSWVEDCFVIKGVTMYNITNNLNEWES